MAGAQGFPYLVVILTDQERHPAHWPARLHERLMPSWQELKRTGLTFNRAYCSAAQCSPSRACLVTGQYAPANGIAGEIPVDGMPNKKKLGNIASVLTGSGGQVFWSGKWHLSYPKGFQGGPPYKERWTQGDIKHLANKYDMRDWNPPDAGNAAGAFLPSDPSARMKELGTSGGGTANNDHRIVEGFVPGSGMTRGFGVDAVQLIRKLAQSKEPFTLFVSLVNPHDITFFPDGWHEAGYSRKVQDLGVPLPPNYGDSLATKPGIQRAYRTALNAKSPLDADPATPRNYVNFYAYLHNVVDPYIGKIIQALKVGGIYEDTIIFRTSDHGELGLSHGLREKSYTAYEEMIHVPLVVSNPKLFPEAKTTEALYSHVDLLPTMLELKGFNNFGDSVGKSQYDVLLDPTASVQDSVLFAFDDSFLLDPDAGGSHIRALRTGRYTYAVYFAPGSKVFEFELYDNQSDPLQMDNLVFAGNPAHLTEWKTLHGQLLKKMKNVKAEPVGVKIPHKPWKDGPGAAS